MSRKALRQQDADESGMFTLATFHTLRIEALDLFDRSLSEGKLDYLERFIEMQVAQEAPPLELLSQIAEDVHQRLLGLQQQHFDARDGIRRTVELQYGVDLTPLLPIDPLEYHRLNIDDALNVKGTQQLTDENRQLLRQMLQDALLTGARLYEEMSVAEYLYKYLTDWLMALHIISVRGSWAEHIRIQEPLKIH